MREANGWRVVALVAGMGAATGISLAQGTDDQRSACYGDAFRLCSAQIPDERAIEACLEANKPSLSPACFAQFDTPAPPPPTPKARVRR